MPTLCYNLFTRQHFYLALGLFFQFIAGLLLIIDQIYSKYPEKIDKFLDLFRNWVKNDADSRGKYLFKAILTSGWRVSLLLAFFSFPAILAIILIFDPGTKLTIGVIAGPILYISIGYSFYLISLQAIFKRTGKWNTTKNKFIGDSKDMTNANLIVFFSTLVIFVLLFYLLTLLQPLASTSSIIGIIYTVLGLIIVFSLFFTLPPFILSLAFLLFFVIMHAFRQIVRIPPILFWILLLLLWTSGGIILIVNALSSA